VRIAQRMNVGIVEIGYVSLVVGACVAKNGKRVACVGKGASNVRRLQRRSIHLFLDRALT